MSDENPYKLHEYVAHSTQVNCLALGPRSVQVLATGGEDTKINVWRVDNTANVWTLSSNKSPIECLSFDHEEYYLCSGARNGSLKIFDLNVGKLARNIGGHQVHITSIHFHPYNEFLVTGSIDNTMKVWDIKSKSCVQTYTGHDREITCTRFSPDGRWIASSGKDGQLLLWDLVAGKLLNTMKLPQNAHLTTFEFNPCEFLLAGASSNRSVRFWDLETMEEIGHTTPDSTTVRAISYAEDGTKLCTANNETLRLWNWDPNVTLVHNYPIGWDRIQEMRTLPGPPSEHVVAISSNSNFVSIWDVDIGYLHEQSLSSVEVAEDRGISNSRERSNSGAVRKPTTASGSSGSTGSSNNLRGNRGSAVNDLDNDFGNGNENVPQLRVDGYFSGPEKKVSQEKKPNVLAPVPEVQWEDGHSTNDLAVSISDSKFRHEHPGSNQTKRSQVPAGNIPVVVTEEEERANHDRFVPSTNPKYLQGRRPITREKEQRDRENLNSRRGEKQAVPTSNNEVGVGLSVVGLRPTTSSEREGNGLSSSPQRVSPPTSTPQSQGGGRYVVQQEGKKVSSERSDIDRVEQGYERENKTRERSESSGNSNGQKNYRRIQSENVLSGQANQGGSGQDRPSGMKRESSLQSFLSNPSPAPAPIHTEEVVSSSDDQSMKEEIETYLTLVMTQSDLTTSILSQRYQTLQQLHLFWSNGEIQRVHDLLHSLLNAYVTSPQSATMSSTISSPSSSPATASLITFSDFMKSIDFHSSIITLNTCSIFLSLFEYGFDCNITSVPVILCMIKGTTTLYQIFRDIIYQTRTAMSAPFQGVDMAREERLEKCNLCYDSFLRIKHRLDGLRERYRKNLSIREALEEGQQALSDLL